MRGVQVKPGFLSLQNKRANIKEWKLHSFFDTLPCYIYTLIPALNLCLESFGTERFVSTADPS